ncbi:MAG: dihydropteroate synthase [Fimbriimonadales bacterium]
MFDPSPDRVAVMGVLNVTPDSFSDGGRFGNDADAIAGAVSMFEAGADIIDVGGESTRPGAESVTVEVELQRTLGVITALTELGIPTSIDTSKPEVAATCVSAGACFVNDVTGFRNPEMRAMVVASNVGVCIMHMQGAPRTMQQNPEYDDVVADVKSFLQRQAAMLMESGLDHARIWIDPGIGFGKTLEHNLSLLKHTRDFVNTGINVLVGVSRKSFIAKVSDSATPAERLPGSLSASLYAVMGGAKMVRTHDVRETVQALQVWQAIQNML